MTEYLADRLAEHFVSLDWVSKTSGLATLGQIKDGDTTRDIPMADVFYKVDPSDYNIDYSLDYQHDTTYTKCIPESYTDMLPNAQESAVIFFEDKGSNIAKRNARSAIYESNVVLKCWVNTKVAQMGYTKTDYINSIIQNIPQTTSSHGIIGEGKLKVGSILPDQPHIYNNYDIENDVNQFIINPYKQFQLEIKILASMSISCNQPFLNLCSMKPLKFGEFYYHYAQGNTQNDQEGNIRWGWFDYNGDTRYGFQHYKSGVWKAGFVPSYS